MAGARTASGSRPRSVPLTASRNAPEASQENRTATNETVYANTWQNKIKTGLDCQPFVNSGECSKRSLGCLSPHHGHLKRPHVWWSRRSKRDLRAPLYDPSQASWDLGNWHQPVHHSHVTLLNHLIHPQPAQGFQGRKICRLRLKSVTIRAPKRKIFLILFCLCVTLQLSHTVWQYYIWGKQVSVQEVVSFHAEFYASILMSNKNIITTASDLRYLFFPR